MNDLQLNSFFDFIHQYNLASSAVQIRWRCIVSCLIQTPASAAHTGRIYSVFKLYQMMKGMTEMLMRYSRRPQADTAVDERNPAGQVTRKSMAARVMANAMTLDGALA